MGVVGAIDSLSGSEAPIDITAIAPRVICGGCVTAANMTAEPREKKVYQTSSDLPGRDCTAPPKSISSIQSRWNKLAIVGHPQGLTR